MRAREFRQIIMWMVDGQLCDGGGQTSAGWAFTKQFLDINSPAAARTARVAPSYAGQLLNASIYTRALRVSEAAASQRAMRDERSMLSPS